MLAINNSHTSKYNYQKQLVEMATKTNTGFSQILSSVGLTYNDLVYKYSNCKPYTGVAPLKLNDLKKHQNNIPLVSFFSGCGGLDLGFEAAGFEHVACFEINELFCKTLRRNRPHWQIYGPPTHNGDVSNTDDTTTILERIISKNFDGIFIGGPPCQPFSIAANQRFSKNGNNFKRIGFANKKNGNLFFDFINIIIHFKPRVFLVENVPGLYDIDNGKQFSEAVELLSKAGYKISTPLIIDAANYGIAQQRIRLFLVGTTSKSNYVPPIALPYTIGCGSILCGTSNEQDLPNSETRIHNATSIARYMELNYGQRDHLGRVDRLNPLLPSKTVIAGGTSGGGRSHLHPEIPRTLSVRECAKLQTFPDDYIFLGPTARQFTQVGNAVPPVLGAQIAYSIQKSFF